jgi:hypothetical protein
MPLPYDYLKSIDSLTDGQPSAQHQRSDIDYREEENFNIWQHPNMLDLPFLAEDAPPSIDWQMYSKILYSQPDQIDSLFVHIKSNIE